MLSLLLDQYHARVKHKEPFSRCYPLWRSLFWRQLWQGPQGRLSLCCDPDCASRAAPRALVPGQPRSPWAKPGTDLCGVQGLGAGLTCGAHLAPLAGLVAQRASEREGSAPPAASTSSIYMKKKGIPTRATRCNQSESLGSPAPGEESWQGRPFGHQVVHLI